MGDGGVGLSAAEGGSDAGNDEELYPLSSRLAAQLERLEAFALNCSKAQREAFLLELISNSYHALDDVFFRGIRQGLYVRVSQCRLAGGDLCLSVVDNGVGMTRGDLINNLSSLSRFEDPAVAESLGAAEQGRGGRSEDLLRMGFWSVFFVAHRIAVQSKHDDDEGYLWELGSKDTHFVIRKGLVADARLQELLGDGTAGQQGQGQPAQLGARGTVVHLLLKETAVEELGLGATTPGEERLRSIVGGWGDAGLAVSSNYPLYFNSDSVSADAATAATQGLASGSGTGSSGNATDGGDLDDLMAAEEGAARSEGRKSDVDSDDEFLQEDEAFSSYRQSRLRDMERAKTEETVEDEGEELEEAAAAGGGARSRDGFGSGGGGRNSSSSSSSSSGRGAGGGGGGVAAEDGAAGTPRAHTPTPTTMAERAKYIPLRLSYEDRRVLRLVEAALLVSHYTDHIDSPALADPKKKHKRLQMVLQNICALLSGMVISCDYDNGQQLLEDRNFAQYERFFQKMFEIIRRYKIMNPEKMRSTYGKLLYLLQDAASDECRELLGFDIIKPIQTVHTLLRRRGGLAMLQDPNIYTASEEILPNKNQTRAQIQLRIKQKERAVERLVQKYRTHQCSGDDIRLCCYSICDNNSYLNSDRLPVDKMLALLDRYFAPTVVSPGYNLAIIQGEDGARLTHSHERQWHFARQSLMLWKAIINDMFRLWSLSESDLLSADAPYSLKNTGQGIQRVQPCPLTYKAMQQLLRDVQSEVDQWIGSSMIHMGDHNVPNALNFIDKYNQVARILGPISITLGNIERLYKEDGGIRDFIDTGYGGLKKLRLDILHDFFRSAFDGSGAENFYDAGSCIDGRLTSAWNWCSQLSSKPYFPIFKLAGFNGFDGEFES